MKNEEMTIKDEMIANDVRMINEEGKMAANLKGNINLLYYTVIEKREVVEENERNTMLILYIKNLDLVVTMKVGTFLLLLEETNLYCCRKGILHYGRVMPL
jgi:hypothetical protein